MVVLQPLLTQTAMAFLTPMTIVQTRQQEPQLELTVVKSTLPMGPPIMAQMVETRQRMATQQHLATTPAMETPMGQRMEPRTTLMSPMFNPIRPSLECHL